MTTEKIDPTPRTKLNRIPQRGHFDRPTVYAILDAALYCHLSLVVDGHPVVLPTIHTRVEDQLYLHGARANRMLTAIAQGSPVCLSVTLIDGLVLAKSGLHHSMNYRSVVVFATGSVVEDDVEKTRALEALVEDMIPGRWSDSRQPDAAELRATQVVRLPINEASAKVRTGPPSDDQRDQDLPHWVGVIPIHSVTGTPIPADYGPTVGVPDYLKDFRQRFDEPARTDSSS